MRNWDLSGSNEITKVGSMINEAEMHTIHEDVFQVSLICPRHEF